MIDAIDPVTGAFEYGYRSGMDTWHPSAGYNILRHAGAIWALAEDGGADASSHREVLAACRYLAAQLLIVESGPHHSVALIWRESGRDGFLNVEAKLGGAGLALAGFIAAGAESQGVISSQELRGLGNIVRSLRRPDGTYISKISLTRGRPDTWESLYYPGEVALGMVMLWGVDRDTEWFAVAREIMLGLADRRADMIDPPHDHWALIATERLLRTGRISAQERSRLNGHAEQIVESIMRQACSSGSLVHGFLTPDRRSTATATRMEGLLTAARLLECDTATIGAVIGLCVPNLERHLVTNGPLTGTVARLGTSGDRCYSEVLIDYAQQHLSAAHGYRRAYRRP